MPKVDSLLTIVNRCPHYAKEALETIYKGKVFVVGTSYGAIYSFIKTRHGAEGYIKKQSRHSWYDDHTHQMVNGGSGLFIEEIKETDILSPSTSKRIWYNRLKEIHGQSHMYNSTIQELNYHKVTDEIREYVTAAIEQMRRHEGLNVIDEYEHEEANQHTFNEEDSSETTENDTQKVTITINKEKDGIEIRFPAKPSADVLTSLKSHGFKWASKASLWWAKQTPERLSFAQSLNNTHYNEEPEEPAEPIEQPSNVIPFARPTDDFDEDNFMLLLSPEQRFKLHAITEHIGEEETQTILRHRTVDELFKDIAESMFKFDLSQSIIH